MRTFSSSWLVPLAVWTMAPVFWAATDLAPRSPATPSAAAPKDGARKEGTNIEQMPGKRDASVDLYWQALKIFRDGKAPDWEHGRALLQEAADQENTTAQNQLGTCYLGGSYGFAKDARKAVNWFRLAAARGDAFSKVNLAQCYFNGIGAGKDHAQAAGLLNSALASDADYPAPEPPADFFARPVQKAGEADETLSGELPVKPADQARASAHFTLGEIATERNDLPLAQDHYVKAATMGDAGRAGIYLAAIKAATNYAFGKGVPRDLAKANDMLDLSKKLSRRLGTVFAHNLVQEKKLDDFAQADVEDAISTAAEKAQHQLQFEIAGSFADPKSKDYDPHEAEKWYEFAAQGGEAWAMVSLALLYQEGTLGQTNPAKAFAWFKLAAEKGKHVLGWANLAICYQNGIGAAKDPEKAATIFKAHCDEDIVCYLGTIGQCPESPLTSERELALNQIWANQKNDPHAQFLLGQRYQAGWGVKIDLFEAADCFEKAAAGGLIRAFYQLGLLYEFNHEGLGIGSAQAADKVLEYYLKGAKAGDANAMANFARYIRHPLGYRDPVGTNDVGMNEDQAAAIYERCLQIDPKQVGAHNDLALIYWNRCLQHASGYGRNGGFSELKEKMLLHFREGDRLGSPQAAFNLGILAYEGKLVDRNFQEAYLHFETAAERGYTEAHWMLGQMHENGEGVPVTYREAAYHYRLAALGGSLPALRRLADFYIKGKGVSQDLDRALFWLSLLARVSGDSTSVVLLGDVLMKKGDYTDALRVFNELTKHSNSQIKGAAYEHLSEMYERGLGVEADPAEAAVYRRVAVTFGDDDALRASAMALMREGKKSEAVPLLEKAAADGLPGANFSLGCLYVKGDGVPKDEAKGWGLIRAAAKKDNIDADVSLALATLQKVPGAPDLEEAIRLAETAEACGHPQAEAVRKQLEALREKPPADTSSSPARPM
jgi:uncharacterized protein